MKLTNIFEDVINEQEILYHGTDSKYDEFDLEKVGSADGKSKGGWGIYLTNDRDVAAQYITTQGKIHEYQLKRGNFFDLDDVIAGQGDQILIGLRKTGKVSDEDLEEFETDYLGYEHDVTNQQAYEWLSYVLGTEKNASLFLKNLGYDGNKFRDKTNPDSKNYVVYDLSIIKKFDGEMLGLGR